MSKLKWTEGPAKAALKDIAEIQVPEGYKMADPQGTQTLLQAMGNPTNGRELGMLAPTSMVWFVVFEFDEVGYVKDDDKDKLDADKLLKSISEGTERSNEARKQMGASAIHVTGWHTPPKYNEATHNLEWAIKGESEGHQFLNYNTRLLGRKGIMEVTLLIAPEKLDATLPTYQALLKDYSFKQGETYAEYKAGDKIAQYGLAALVAGGAAAVAAKLGLFAWLAVAFKKFWKLIVVAFVAVASFFKRLIFGREKRAE